MTCEELAQLLPDLVDGKLSPEIQAEAEAALAGCPNCQRELEIARQVRALMVRLLAENPRLELPPGFENRLLSRIRRQSGGLELVDLSAKVFGFWLAELVNLLGGLLGPQAARGTKPAGAAGN